MKRTFHDLQVGRTAPPATPSETRIFLKEAAIALVTILTLGPLAVMLIAAFSH